MNTVKRTTRIFTYLSYMFRLPHPSHHQAAQNHKKEMVYMKPMGEISTLQKNTYTKYGLLYL